MTTTPISASAGSPPGGPAAGRSSLVGAAVGALLVATPVAVLATRWNSVLAGHPAYLVTLVVVLVGGLLLVATGLRSRTRPARAGRLLVARRIMGVLLALLLVGVLVYLVPLPATPDAVAAGSGSAAVAVDDSATRITLTPVAGAPRAGLVFQPGAKVDPRAYLPLLTRVSEQGYLVVVVKQPFSIGFAAIGAPAGVVDDHPEVPVWAVGGHSLGGVAAASFAGRPGSPADGLLLWASYPLRSLADTDLVVSSVSGTRDGLSTPTDIQASRADLPDSTTFVAVQGAVHAFFGDYGDQAGDGIPTVSRADAQTRIVEATTAFMTDVAVGRG